MYRTLFGYLLICLLISVGSGCSGGSGDPAVTDATTDTTPTLPSAENFVDIAAIAGPIVAVRVGEAVMLDDTKSYVRSDEPLSYSWSFAYKPAGSNATLEGAATANPSFVADVRGIYMLQLVVSAGGVTSERAITSVVATIPPERLTGPFNHAGLSSQCVLCHDGVNLKSGGELLLPKVPDHHATSNMCEACHTPLGFATAAFVDHQEVFGACSECHNGVQAIGKSEFHTPTEAECDDCHNTTSFLELGPDGSFDHSNITRVCASCHNGAVATGKTPTISEGGTHPDTNTECGYCHTTVSFQDAYPDHTGPAVTGTSCDSCHVADGSGSALGQSVGHPLTNAFLDCDTCHSIASFKLPGGVFNHSVVDPTVQSCESCHNDSTSINAPTKSSAVPAHPATNADCGACHATESFSPAFGVDHTDPAILSQRCDHCHNGADATGIPLSTPFYEHMPIGTEDCKVCHSPGTFGTGTYDHAGVTNNCNSCHNNVIGVGKLPNHIPTTPDNQDCADCHNTTDFADTTFGHVGIDTSNCTLCHDGNISTGKSLTHVPTSLDCSSCHSTSNFNSFAGITFNHQGIDPNDCASCHNTGIATGKTLSHIPAENECSVCHDSTATFASSMFLGTVHQGLTTGCEGCHVSRFFPANPNVVKSASHLPTGQDCHVCHTTNAFMPSIFDHTGITGDCVSCHNGDFVALNARAKTNSPVHQTNQDCGVCHNTTDFADAFVDHSGPEVVGKRCDSCHDGGAGGAIGKNPGHIVTNEDCSVCHVPGSFKTAVFSHAGIVDNCASCHNGTAATGKSAGHLPTTQDCAVCHVTTAFAGARFDHTGITGNCDSCHNGNTARGKTPPPDHVPTNKDCNTCHVTTGFRPATFSHAGIVDNCRSCHNNVFAIGKSANHVATNQDCGVCHNTRTFVGAVFDHTGIVDNCSSCHGVSATGKHSSHIATSADCHFCHTTASFVGGTWFHDASTAGRCDECHSSGGGATSKPRGHLSTNVQCDACHSTDRWAPDIFSHDPRGNYPGDHRRNPGCSGCHGSSISSTFAWPSPRYAPYCAACHERDFRSEGDHIGGRNGTVEQNKDCSGGGRGCHKITSSGF
ncbi:MAG: cytochrome c3 family protein [Gammaproteobacteria bacterium]